MKLIVSGCTVPVTPGSAPGCTATVKQLASEDTPSYTYSSNAFKCRGNYLKE